MKEAYDKLVLSIEKNEFKDFLIGKGNYRVNSPEEKNFDIMNNYQAVTLSLNEYGKVDNSFGKIINSNMIEILESKKPLSTYSICQIVRIQMGIENKGLNTVDFIDENLLLKLKDSILFNKEFYDNFRRYEAENKENGMSEVINDWNNDLCQRSGKGFL